jgi:hypothetical protein
VLDGPGEPLGDLCGLREVELVPRRLQRQAGEQQRADRGQGRDQVEELRPVLSGAAGPDA